MNQLDPDRMKVRGGVVTPDDRKESRRAGQRGEERPQGEDEAGNLRDPVLDPADAPKRPPPGTGGGDGAPMG